MKKAYLLLADGTLFEGTAVGYEGQSIGEVVFNTGMAGYQEVLTDPVLLRSGRYHDIPAHRQLRHQL